MRKERAVLVELETRVVIVVFWKWRIGSSTPERDSECGRSHIRNNQVGEIEFEGEKVGFRRPTDFGVRSDKPGVIRGGAYAASAPAAQQRYTTPHQAA